MNLNTPSTLLSSENTQCNLEVSSKKALLEIISKKIFKDVQSDSWETVFDTLIAREKVGTTGFGNGIAIPHCRLASCTKATAFFTKLKKPINYDAIDSEPVDLVFALIVPLEAHEEHLNILSTLASVLDNNNSRIALRECNTHTELYQRIIEMLAG